MWQPAVIPHSLGVIFFHLNKWSRLHGALYSISCRCCQWMNLNASEVISASPDEMECISGPSAGFTEYSQPTQTLSVFDSLHYKHLGLKRPHCRWKLLLPTQNTQLDGLAQHRLWDWLEGYKENSQWPCLNFHQQESLPFRKVFSKIILVHIWFEHHWRAITMPMQNTDLAAVSTGTKLFLYYQVGSEIFEASQTMASRGPRALRSLLTVAS